MKFGIGANNIGIPNNAIRMGSLCIGFSTTSSDLSIEGEEFMFISQIILELKLHP